MNVSIWDKVHRCWLDKRHIEYIVQLDNRSFKIDGIEYDTTQYELNFIHKEKGV